MNRLSDDVLAVITPGHVLREGIERIIKARKGALIMIGLDEKVEEIRSSGFTMNAKLTAQNLSELAKMDGAILIDDTCSKILYANVHLQPSAMLSSEETGTRHRTADRAAQQTGRIAITVSESMQIVTVFMNGQKYVLESSSEVMFRGNQAVSTLERYRTRLDEVSDDLYQQEINSTVRLRDVLQVIQRAERVLRISDEIEYAIKELGIHGRLLQMQYQEILHGVDRILEEVIADYTVELATREEVLATKKRLGEMSDHELLSNANLAGLLGHRAVEGIDDQFVSPYGIRALRQVPGLPGHVVNNLIQEFKSLDAVMHATLEELDAVDGVGHARAMAIQHRFTQPAHAQDHRP